jgi:hypothetical protein
MCEDLPFFEIVNVCSPNYLSDKTTLGHLLFTRNSKIWKNQWYLFIFKYFNLKVHKSFKPIFLVFFIYQTYILFLEFLIKCSHITIARQLHHKTTEKIEVEKTLKLLAKVIKIM